MVDSRQGSSKTSAISNATGCDDNYILSCEGTLTTPTDIDDSGDEDREGSIARMASTLATLSTNNVNT